MSASRANVTIRDVAKESGVSVATVSYVLNDGPRSVRPQTRQRVLDVMRRLNYHPNAMARGLVRRQMHTLGVLFGMVEPEIVTNPYAAAVLQGIFSAGANRGYNITLFTEPWRDAHHSAPAFRDRRADGMIVVAPMLDSDMVSGLAALGLPLVVVSAPSLLPGIPFVDVDNKQGGRLAAAHLLALGHTRIGHISGDLTHASVTGRREGFETALAEAGIPLPPEYLKVGSYGFEPNRPVVREMLSLPCPPTAIFAGSDQIAFAVLEVARDMGIFVPKQLSLVGFDDVATAARVSPALTTIRQPLSAMGNHATHMLVNQLEEINGADIDAGAAGAVLEDASLIVRETTGPVYSPSSPFISPAAEKVSRSRAHLQSVAARDKSI